MTVIAPPEGEGNSEDILLIAEKHFDRMLRRAEDIITALDDEDGGVSKEAATRIRDLSKAMQSALDERAKFEKLRNNRAGIVHEYALDFDAARDEIGRRMARLRGTKGAGSVSE